MIHAIRRLILAYPNSALCFCGFGLLLTPFAIAMLLMTVYDAYDHGTIPAGRFMDSAFWFMGAFRYFGIPSWIAGTSLIAFGVARELRKKPAPGPKGGNGQRARAGPCTLMRLIEGPAHLHASPPFEVRHMLPRFRGLTPPPLLRASAR